MEQDVEKERMKMKERKKEREKPPLFSPIKAGQGKKKVIMLEGKTQLKKRRNNTSG